MYAVIRMIADHGMENGNKREIFTIFISIGQ